MAKLSIITINLNNFAGLQKTMESVFAQTFTDCEYIVIDGGSSDGSIDEIKKHSDKLSYWVSEKDKGIYNAMNKGILKAKGEYLLFLNSGDYLFSNDAISNLTAAAKGLDIVYGIMIVDNKLNRYNKEYPEKLKFSYFLKDTLPHPCSLIKRNLFHKFGLYNENLKSTSDWEFFLKVICLHNASYKYVPIPITVFNMDGISSQEENWKWILLDKKAVLEKSFSAFMDDYKKLKDNEQQLISIKNSRIWKMRNRVEKIGLFKYFINKG